MTKKHLKNTVAVTAILAALSFVAPAQAGELNDRHRFDIKPQSLEEALIDFSKQSGVQVIASSKVIFGLNTSGYKAKATADDALRNLLHNTGLTYLIEEGEAVTILLETANNPAYRAISFNTDEYYEGNLEAYDDDKKQDEIVEMDEVTVTGSHIRGAGPVGSQVITFDRDDIDMKGYSTLPQLIQSLPQNFNGGMSESTSQLDFSNDSSNNITGGTSINLRGLGNVSTLVLLNGQRLAPSGLNGGSVDISMIPLSAVERVEVLTDGASAIYGSDAIGGVVNFKLRKDYDGAETRVRYGAATGGGLEEVLVGQTFGKTWDSGHGLISYEYNHRDALDAQDRSFSKDAPVPNDLLPEQRRHSFFLTGGQKLTDNLAVFTTAYYNKRDSVRNLFVVTSPDRPIGKAKQYGGTLGGTLDLDSSFGNGWRGEVVGSYGRSENIIETPHQPERDDTFVTRASKNLSVDANFDGSLFSMAGGDAKLAVGGHFRHNTLGDLDISLGSGQSIISPVDTTFSRNVTALYAELYLPLVGSDNRRSGVERLELSISGRYEHYSDFGSSTDPKFGLLWSPIEGVNLRATYGTSFRAPLFTELDERLNQAILLNFPTFMSTPANSLVIVLSGFNKDLQPEVATLWTAGFDLQPVSIPTLNIGVSYFNINYKDRIVSTNPFQTILDPRFAEFIDFDGPDADFFASIENLTQSNFTSFPGFGPAADFADAEVVIDGRTQNLSRNKISGLDFSVSYGLETEDAGNWTFSLNGTYLFNFLEQVIEGDVETDVLGLISHPVDLRMNGGVSWGYEGFTSNLSIYYVDSYVDDRADVPVNSWTTVNLTLNYNTEDRFDNWLNNTVFSLSAVNLFDRDPPFVTALRAGLNINYDPSAASPSGRVLSFQITKQW